MNTAIADYLSSLEFPSLIAENTSEECFINFRQEYNFILQSLLPTLPPLLEKPEKNQYLIVALLKTLAERESLLRHNINQLLYLLLPSPKTQEKHLAHKNTYLDEIIALFGMERESRINPQSELTPPLPESDSDLKVRLASRLGILNNAGTESYYKHHFLSLNATIQDVLIEVKPTNTGELIIYLLAKIPRPESTEAWLEGIKLASEKKAINPVADSYKLFSATIRYYTFSISEKNHKSKKNYLKVNELIKTYADKKYQFNSVISRTEFFSYLEEASLENLEINLYQCSEKGEDKNLKERIECKPGEVPCLVEDTESNSYK